MQPRLINYQQKGRIIKDAAFLFVKSIEQHCRWRIIDHRLLKATSKPKVDLF